QGKRLVPANRVRALAEALEVSLEELLDGVSGAHRPSPKVLDADTNNHTPTNVSEFIEERTVRPMPMDEAPLLRLVPQTSVDEPAGSPPTDGEVTGERWVIPERPPLEGWIHDGWQPTDRIQDI